MNDYRLNWTLPAQPLGEAIKPEKPVKVCEFREFETKDYESLGTVPHGRMPSARGGAGVGQTDDGALASGLGMRARNAEGSPASSPPQSKWTPKVGDRVRFIHPGSRVHGHTGKLLRLYKKMGYECCDIEWDDGDRDQFGWLTSLELLP